MTTFRFLFPYARPYLWYYVAGFVFVPLSTYCALAVPRIIGDALSVLERDAAATAVLAPLVGWVLAYSAGRAAGLFATRFLIITASRHIEFDLRNRLYRHLLGLDRSFYRSARTGDLMSRATLDVEAARTVVGPAVMYMVNGLFMLCLALPLMLSVSATLTALTLVPLLFLSWSVRFIGPRVQAAYRRAQETLAELSSFAQENFGGMRVVKAFAMEDRERDAFDGLSDEYYRRSLATERISNWMGPVVGAVGEATVVCLLIVGGLLRLDDAFSYGDFVAFSGYQAILIWPMISIGWVVNQAYRGVASVERLEQVFSSRSTVESPATAGAPRGDAAAPAAPRGEIEIRGLTFAYGSRVVLDDIRMRIPAGSTVAILGRTGAGKSTLVSLLPRLHPVPDGTIFLDGADINTLPLDALRRAIGFVPQDTFLFSRAIGENIAFAIWDGRGEAPRDALRSWGAAARIDKDIDQFPRGYDEIVGERGVTLSGGQRQRVAIARALAAEPRILVLDDALSAVDTHTEEEILANLAASGARRTTIVVAHRISSIKNADRIYVLDAGRVAEQGSHDELMRRDGLYAELYRRQLLASELEDL